MMITALGMTLGAGLLCVLCLAVFVWLEVAAGRKEERLRETQMGRRQQDARRAEKSRGQTQARERSAPEHQAAPAEPD